MNSIIKIGMISFAHMHAFSYATNLKQISGVEIVGIWDADANRGQTQARHFDTHYFDTIDALLGQGLDAVVICSENANHRQHVEAAAGKVKAILCEKPISTNVADALAMIDRCQATNTRLQIAFPVRFSAPVQDLKRRIERGDLGRVFSVKCTNHGRNPGGWFVDPTLSGGGAVLDHTVHVIDLLRWFWGTEVSEVFAEIGRNSFSNVSPIDDAGLLSFKLANGVYGTLDTSWSRPSSYPTWGDVKIEVLGEKGLVCVDAFAQKLSVSSNQKGNTQWVGWGSDIDYGLVNDFVDMVRSGREPSITGMDGLRAMEVALAAYQAEKQGEPVKLGA
ncbi:MAG: Gfo/Idh/MocA family oxidoreductase [Caldilineaceae bacterium]